ncbi:Ubiquitin-conjugating enzyme E2 G1 [Eumeta japonica]|uniref:E2 ubiquitin-conjugating enzyme n=1 Tax=Eumeta variegata TaxID=151549 RepID=A0A4C1Y3Y9_EUMVA|nr:Ubiquitin-conjugating enzyme E2 G1 [Eumeta japonica]
MSEPQSSLLLKKQLAELNKNPVEGFSAGLIDDNDIYRWEVLIIGPPDTLYEGGFFKAHLHFPKEYPLRPPRMKFVTEIWHPNIEKNGDVCISILHEPGDDKWGYEKASERWLPVHTVETILISVISMLADPNDESPANVDAAVSVFTFIPIMWFRFSFMVGCHPQAGGTQWGPPPPSLLSHATGLDICA